jgi:hypothetical protein
MSLRLRRGLNTDRTTITPEEGELLYTTDTKRLFIGDGTTLGGNPVNSISAMSYTHTQSIAASTWTVTHNLGYKPGGIKVFDSADTEWFGSIVHIDDNSLTIDFNGSVFGGKAYIS